MNILKKAASDFFSNSRLNSSDTVQTTTETDNTIQGEDKHILRGRYKQAKKEIKRDWKHMLNSQTVTKSYELTSEYRELCGGKSSKRDLEDYIQEFERFKQNMLPENYIRPEEGQVEEVTFGKARPAKTIRNLGKDYPKVLEKVRHASKVGNSA